MNTPPRILGSWDAPARTMWNNGSRLWITQEELRVSNANGYGRDRVVRHDPLVELRVRQHLLGTGVEWRRAGERWRRLCTYLRTSGTTVPVALMRAGWMAPEGELDPYPPVFFQCCRVRRFAGRGWCVVDEGSLSVQRRTGTTVVSRDSVKAIRLVPRGRLASVEVLSPGRETTALCSTFSPGDLRGALVASGWPVE